MVASSRREDEGSDRLFVRGAFRHYRKRYSLPEVRWGGLVGLVLLAIAGWVAYRGAHPDPALFAAPLPTSGASAAGGGALERGARARGVLPAEIAGPGWSEGPVSTFGPDTLYEKINGRADYYKSFGFERLTFVSLTQAGGAGQAVVDVELYDLGRASNALGAYAGERRPESASRLDESGLSQLGRNALMLTHGRYYVRAIGSEESAAVREQLERVERAFRETLAADPLPWGYALFVGQLGLAPDRVSYVAENAFSFGFARDVYIGRTGDDEAEVFVVAVADEHAAEQLATKLVEGFSSLGGTPAPIGGVRLVADPYLGTLAGATAHGRWVVGVHRAPDRERARSGVEQLRRALDEMPDALRRRAIPAAPPGAAGGGEAEHEATP